MAKQKEEKPKDLGQTETEEKKEAFSWRNLFQSRHKESDQSRFFDAFVVSDKNNKVKARISNAFVQTHVDLMGAQMSDSYETVDQMLSMSENGNSNSWGDIYRINTISLGGLSRQEARDVAIGINPEYLDPNVMKNRKEKLNEGNR
jgi:hypothetical protein